jgi:hypothetical protein
VDSLAFKATWPVIFAEQMCWKEFEIPEVALLSPSVGRSNLDWELGGLYLVPSSHFMDYLRNDWQQALANMVTRELFALKDHNSAVGHVSLEQAAATASRRPATDYGYIELNFLHHTRSLSAYVFAQPEVHPRRD